MNHSMTILKQVTVQDYGKYCKLLVALILFLLISLGTQICSALSPAEEIKIGKELYIRTVKAESITR